MRALELPGVLRRAGLVVHEVSGWKARGADTFGPIRGITCHETRGSLKSTDAGEIGVLINGSNSAPPPIAQLYLSRTGAWHVVASGTCNHNRVGWGGPNEGYGNDALLGIEAQHALNEPWTEVQYSSYVRGVAALVDYLEIPVAHVAGHKEHQPGQKTDPGFDMDEFRADVTWLLARKEENMTPAELLALLKDESVARWVRALAVQYTGGGIDSGKNVLNVMNETHQNSKLLAPIAAELAATRTALEALAEAIRSGGGSVDAAVIGARIDQAVAAAVEAMKVEVRDSVADLGEGGAQQVRGLQG